MRIALTGNPNSGKTTMYNALTGRSERVGNWAGVTVDKKESPVKPQFNPQGLDLVAVDLPGAYSMSPFTSEESITSSYVRQERPDVIVNIVDATNYDRSTGSRPKRCAGTCPALCTSPCRRPIWARPMKRRASKPFTAP